MELKVPPRTKQYQTSNYQYGIHSMELKGVEGLVYWEDWSSYQMNPFNGIER